MWRFGAATSYNGTCCEGKPVSSQSMGLRGKFHDMVWTIYFGPTSGIRTALECCHKVVMIIFLLVAGTLYPLSEGYSVDLCDDY